jgi:hypothetical protein
MDAKYTHPRGDGNRVCLKLPCSRRSFPEQEQEHPSYSIQYRASDLESIKLYMQMYAPELRNKSLKAWGNHALAFRTLLEVIDEK